MPLGERVCDPGGVVCQSYQRHGGLLHSKDATLQGSKIRRRDHWGLWLHGVYKDTLPECLI